MYGGEKRARRHNNLFGKVGSQKKVKNHTVTKRGSRVKKISSNDGGDLFI